MASPLVIGTAFFVGYLLGRDWKRSDGGATTPATPPATSTDDAPDTDLQPEEAACAEPVRDEPASEDLSDGESQASSPASQQSQPPGEVDSFVVLSGIGPTYNRRLHEAGIHSFAQLAQLEPDTIRDIIKPQIWHDEEAQRWREQALHLAGDSPPTDEPTPE